MSQMKEQDKTPEKQLSELEISSLHEKDSKDNSRSWGKKKKTGGKD